MFTEYDNRQQELQQSIERMQTANMSFLPDEYQERLNESYQLAGATFELIEVVRVTEHKFEEFTTDYRPLHVEVRLIQKAVRKLADDIEELNQQRQRIAFSEDVDQSRIDNILERIARLESTQKELEAGIPVNWESARAEFIALAKAEKMARLKDRQNADDSYAIVGTVQKMISQTDALTALQLQVDPLIDQIRQLPADEGLDVLKAYGIEIDELTETHGITSKLSRAKRVLRGNTPDKEQAVANIMEAAEILRSEIKWRHRAEPLANELQVYDQAIASTLGMRMQQRLTIDQSESIASCLAIHKDVSLHF